MRQGEWKATERTELKRRVRCERNEGGNEKERNGTEQKGQDQRERGEKKRRKKKNRTEHEQEKSFLPRMERN